VRFGTDSIRGVANEELTPEVALALGRAAASVLGGPLVVGRDTRVSGPMLEAAFVAGAVSAGADCHLLGVAPSPAIAWAAARLDLPGAVISASHNPWSDNGIKLFGAGGRKLDDEAEAAVEEAFHADPPRGEVGSVVTASDLADGWAQALPFTVGPLDGITVVVDCSNGAASAFGPDVLRATGATVVVLHAEPDGRNINAGCGATYPEVVAGAVVEHGADLGLALDGDADRCIAVDATGAVVDGDQILTVLALDRRERGALPHETVVVTVMSNLGFRLAMVEHGITVVETAVGDRYVLEAMEAGGFALGGEQSGHVIQRDLATTGDGLLTGLHLCDVVARTGRPLADLAGAMTKLPQVLRNVRVERRDIDVGEEIAAAEAELGDHGRVLLRPSGTEPLVRVMVEAPTAEQAASVADRLAAAVAAQAAQ
jgi:phosphoglucosamine mutase